MDVKYVVVDTSDSYHTSVRKFTSKDEMLDSIQYRELDEIEVWEVKGRVKLIKRPAIVMEEGDSPYIKDHQ